MGSNKVVRDGFLEEVTSELRPRMSRSGQAEEEVAGRACDGRVVQAGGTASAK